MSKIIDSGILSKDCCYIAMESLGSSLKDIAMQKKRTFTIKTIC